MKRVLLLALLIGFLFLLSPAQAFYINADPTLDTGNLTVISHGISTSNASAPECFSKTYSSGEIHFNNTYCLNYENVTFFFEVLNYTWTGYKHLVGGDKEILVKINYSLTDNSNLAPLNLPRIGIYWVQDTTLKGQVAEYQLTGSDISTGVWHFLNLTGIIPPEATGYYVSFNWEWNAIPSYTTIKFTEFDTRTYDLIDTGTDITDTYLETVCNYTGTKYDPFAITREGKLAKVRYTGPVYEGRYCGVLLLDRALVTRLMTYEDRVSPSVPAHQMYIARDWAIQKSFASQVVGQYYWTNQILLDKIKTGYVRGTALDTSGTDPNQKDCTNITGRASVDVDYIEGELGGSVTLGLICDQIGDSFRENVDISSGFLTGDNWRFASYSGIGHTFQEASPFSPFFDSTSCKQRQTFCIANWLRTLTSECFTLNETSCGLWGCDDEGLTCNPITVGCFCTAPQELTCYNTTGHITEQHVCTWGCNETVNACNPNPETGEPETFCNVDADCSVCVTGINTIFTKPVCIGGTCHYTVSTYCTYGILPAPICACAPKPYTETASEYVGTFLGIPPAMALFLIAILSCLGVSGGITYYIGKTTEGGIGGTGLGIIFGITFIAMLFAVTWVGWVDILVFIILLILAGMLVAWQIVKAVGG